MSTPSGRILLLLDSSSVPCPFDSILDLLKSRPDLALVVLHGKNDEDAIRHKVTGHPQVDFHLQQENESVEDLLLSWSRKFKATAVACISSSSPGEIEACLLSWEQGVLQPGVIAPLLPRVALPAYQFQDYPLAHSGWAASLETALDLLKLHGRLGGCDFWTLFELVDRLGYCARWRLSSPPVATGPGAETNPQAPLHFQSKVLAVVPHFRCETWLEQCLHSLVHQTRKPDDIVVVDDASGNPPREIVSRFPGVILLTTDRNIGPEQILHHVMKATDYDAYLVQDADDWSAENRLELLLHEAQRSGAELLGTQCLELMLSKKKLLLRTFPLDATNAMRKNLGYYLSHGSSLIARSLSERIGGFDASFRLSADHDFLYRATQVARVVNIPEFAYFRRQRRDSLTTAKETGIYSHKRGSENIVALMRAQKNFQILASGNLPDARAKKQPDPIKLLHLLGPSLRAISLPLLTS